MWRRVTSQSPTSSDGPNRAYIKAFAAIAQLLLEGRSLSGNERHCCFINTHDGRFATASAACGVDFPEDGRGVGLTDWDHDGDVDLWVANRTGPRLRFLRNESGGGSFLTIKLTGTQCNRDAIGARVELDVRGADAPTSSSPMKLVRTVTAGHGFLSQASLRVHFGFPRDHAIDALRVLWPDGSRQEFKHLAANEHYQLTQGDAVPAVWHRPAPAAAIEVRPFAGEPLQSQSRTVVVARLPMPAIDYKTIQEDAHPAAGPSPILINLWSTTCTRCLQELGEFGEQQDTIRAAGLQVMALNVDELIDDPNSDLARSKELLKSLQFPFAAAAVSAEYSGMLDIFHRTFLSLRRPLPVPSSFLATADGRVAVIYRGPVSVAQVLNDCKLLNLAPVQLRDASVPFPGKWLAAPPAGDPKDFSIALMRAGFHEQGRKYLESYLLAHRAGKAWGPQSEWPSRTRLSELCDSLADFYRLKNEPRGVIAAYQLALDFDPKSVNAMTTLGKAMIRSGQVDQGLAMFTAAAKLAPNQPQVRADLAVAYAMTNKLPEAEAEFKRLLASDPSLNEPHWQLARLYQQMNRPADAIEQMRIYVAHEPLATEAIYQLAWTLVTAKDESQRNVPEAKRWAQQLHAKMQDSSEYLDLLGVIADQERQPAAAAKYAQEALNRLPDTAPKAQRQAIESRLKRYQAGSTNGRR